MVVVEDVLADEAIRAYLTRIIGEEGLGLLDNYPGEGEYSDEELAEKTGINLNSIRHTLYTLYGRRLAEYRRIKNSETGWLTYLWTMRLDNLDLTLYEDMETILDKLEARRRYEEENDFYICKSCGLIYTFDEAFARDFECNNCEVKLDHFDNELLLNALKKRVDAIKESLGKA